MEAKSERTATKVFVSYIAEEEKLAKILKNHIENDFLGLVELFTFSDRENNPVGGRWLDNLDKELGDAEVQLILCSKESVSRPWINFETGAGWLKKIPVIPVCHTDMQPSVLPRPLDMLTAIEANQREGLETLYAEIARRAKCKTPRKDLREMLEEIDAFERQYKVERMGKEEVDQRLEDIDQGLSALTLGIAELELREKITVIRYRATKIKEHAESYGRDEIILLTGDCTAGLPLFEHAPKETRVRYVNAVIDAMTSLDGDRIVEGADFQKRLLDDLIRDVVNQSKIKKLKPEIAMELDSLIKQCEEHLRERGII